MENKKHFKALIFLSFIVFIIIGAIYMSKKFHSKEYTKDSFNNQKHYGCLSVEQAIKNRRSIRTYEKAQITKKEIFKLLFAAQGITNEKNKLRSAPSAGATYPLEIYVAAGNVKNLEPGIYKYNPIKNEINKITSDDKRQELCNSSLGQEWIKEACAVIIICADYKKTTQKYGDRGKRYVHMEAGAVAENVYLQSQSLNIGTVFVGAFDDNEVKQIIKAQNNEEPLCLMPLGKINVNNKDRTNTMAKQAIEIVDLDVSKLIAELSKNFADEWLAYYQYWLGAKLAKGPMKNSVVAELEEHALDELRHAQMLAERIIQLGETPPINPQEWYKITGCGYLDPKDPHVKILLQQNIKGEQCAIRGYNELIKMVKDKDFVTYKLASEILADEVEHEDDLKNLLEDIILINK